MRSYLFRLPLFTRLMLLVIFGLWLLELQTVWSVIDWGALIPNEVGIGAMYRLNTYPLVHNGFIHMVMDVVCLAPLLERFEAEWGTFNCVALFLGRKLDFSFLLFSSWTCGLWDDGYSDRVKSVDYNFCCWTERRRHASKGGSHPLRLARLDIRVRVLDKTFTDFSCSIIYDSGSSVYHRGTLHSQGKHGGIGVQVRTLGSCRAPPANL